MSGRKPVLVVVDVQNGFITEHSKHVVPVIADLVRRWQAAAMDIVFTRYLNYTGSPFERLMGWTRMVTAPETDLAPEVASLVSPRASVVDKYIYSLFTADGTALVHERGWTDLYICGIATESCVLKTAVDAFERDLTPWILEDACASHAGQLAHEAGLLVTGRFIGDNQIINIARLPATLVPSPA